MSEGPARKMIGETYPLPPSTAGDRRPLMALLERVLGLGGVVRLVLEYGKPLRVSRLVSKDEMPDAPEDLVDGDIYNSARNNEMADLGAVFEKEGAYEALFRAFNILTSKHLKPRALLVHTHKEMNSWLMVEANREIPEVYGVEVRTYKEIPERTALLTASTWGDPDTVVFSLRIEMVNNKGKKA